MIAHLCLQKLKDWKLALAVAVLVLIDVITLLVYTIVERLRGNLKAILVRNEENPSAEIGVRFTRFIITLSCVHLIILCRDKLSQKNSIKWFTWFLVA